MARSLAIVAAAWARAAKGAPAHAIPATARQNKARGSQQEGRRSCFPNWGRSITVARVISQSPVKMPRMVVDQGNDIAINVAN
jgi:hypothetical protein